jgi:hypothetical protein
MSFDNKEIVALDASNSKDLEHVYFEPKFLSDIEVIYNKKIYHLHQCVLMKESLYFKNMLEEDQVCAKIEIPILKEPIYSIFISDITRFLKLLYNGSRLTADGTTCCSDCSIDGKRHVDACENLMTCSVIMTINYFQTFRLEKILRTSITTIAPYQKKQGAIILLVVCCIYSYELEKKLCIDAVSNNPLFFTFEEWKLVPVATRELIYQKVICNLTKV